MSTESKSLSIVLPDIEDVRMPVCLPSKDKSISRVAQARIDRLVMENKKLRMQVKLLKGIIKNLDDSV